jgi:plastocyanin
VTAVPGKIFLVAIAFTLVSLAPPGAAQAETHVIKMAHIAFAPAAITVRVGDTVEWQNSDIVAHTATSKEAGFDVNVTPGDNGSTTVKAAGRFNYMCRYHPNMKGEIIVQP